MSTHEPLDIKPDTLYPLDWLEERLQGVVSVKTLFENIGLDCAGRGRVCQNVVLGREILRAYDSAIEGLKTRENASMGHSRCNAPVPAGAEKRKRGRPAKSQRVDLITISDLA